MPEPPAGASSAQPRMGFETRAVEDRARLGELLWEAYAIAEKLNALMGSVEKAERPGLLAAAAPLLAVLQANLDELARRFPDEPAHPGGALLQGQSPDADTAPAALEELSAHLAERLAAWHGA